MTRMQLSEGERYECSQVCVSFIICCHNSESRIPGCLRYLASQKNIDARSVELILVNNASTDQTVTIAQSIWIQLGSPFPLKVVEEPRLGLAFARITGVCAAKGQFGIFCDDDNWLPSNYTADILELFAEHSEVGVVGSASIPVSNEEFPHWFYRLSSKMAVGSQSESVDGDITDYRPFVWGAGLAFRVDPIKSLYGRGVMPQVMGRQGNKLTSGDDAEFCVWFVMMGYRVWYQDSLVIQHYMPPERLTEEYRQKFNSVGPHPLLKSYFAFIRLKFGLCSRDRYFFRQTIQLVRLLLSPRDAMNVIGIYRNISKCMPQTESC